MCCACAEQIFGKLITKVCFTLSDENSSRMSDWSGLHFKISDT